MTYHRAATDSSRCVQTSTNSWEMCRNIYSIKSHLIPKFRTFFVLLPMPPSIVHPIWWCSPVPALHHHGPRLRNLGPASFRLSTPPPYYWILHAGTEWLRVTTSPNAFWFYVLTLNLRNLREKSNNTHTHTHTRSRFIVGPTWTTHGGSS